MYIPFLSLGKSEKSGTKNIAPHAVHKDRFPGYEQVRGWRGFCVDIFFAVEAKVGGHRDKDSS